MANVITPNFNYTYDGILVKELFYEPTVKAPLLQDVFTIIQRNKSKMQLPIPNAIGKSLQAISGCSLPTGESVDITNVTLETCKFGSRFDQCASTFWETYLEEELPSGLSQFEMNQYLIGIATQIISDAVTRNIFRHASFGDTDSANAYWNVCDGLFKKLIEGIATYQVKFVDDISTLNQTAGTRALDYLNNIWTGADIILKQMPVNQKQILVTGNFFENLVINYQNGALSNGGLTLEYQQGIPRPRYNGVEIKPVYAWDEALMDSTNPYAADFNTVLLYTAKENHVIGLDSSNDMQQLDIWYDKKDLKVYFDVMFNMGYQFIHGGLTAISYGTV